MGVFGIALSTVILPHLSRKHSSLSNQDFSKTLNWAMRWVCLVCVPATVGLIILAKPMVTTIYYHGDFSVNGVNMTVASLIAYSIGLMAIVMVKVLAPGFYARQNTKTPVRIAMISMGLNIIFCLILVYPLKHVGLALATSLAAFFNALLLYIALRKEKIFEIESGWLLFVIKIIFCSLLMGLSLWWLMGNGDAWLLMSIWDRALKLVGLLLVGVFVYFGSLILLGLRPRSMLMAKEN